MLSATRRRRELRTLPQLREYFRTLSDGARLRILSHLAASPHDLTVSEIAHYLEMSQPLCSWHLHRLVKIGLVRIRRVGREARCSFDRARVKEFDQIFLALLGESYASDSRSLSVEKE